MSTNAGIAAYRSRVDHTRSQNERRRRLEAEWEARQLEALRGQQAELKRQFVARDRERRAA